MYVSAPIPQLALSLSPEFENREDSLNCMELISDLTSTSHETGSDAIDGHFKNFIKRIPNEKRLVRGISSFLSAYFSIAGHDELAKSFETLFKENLDYGLMSPKDSGYIVGIISTCLMADSKVTKITDLPSDVKEAIKYIEKHDLKVRLEK